MTKAIIIKKPGGPEVLEITDIKLGTLDPDQIKVKNASTKAPSFVAKSFLLLVNFYRYAISPLFPSRCRYYPTSLRTRTKRL